MSTAGQQRLKRTRIPHQLTLELDIQATLDLASVNAPAREQPDFERIATEVAAAQPRTPDPWADSPYAWVKKLPPARRGATGQLLLARWLTHCGVPNEPRHGPGDHDLTIGVTAAQVRAQTRTSTLWSGGDFIFQSIRPGQYDVLTLLAIAPHRVYLWVVPQGTALAHADTSGWITVPATGAPGWLRPLGGTLTTATRLLPS